MNKSLSNEFKKILKKQDLGMVKSLCEKYEFDEILKQIKLDEIGIFAYPNSKNENEFIFLNNIKVYANNINNRKKINDLYNEILILNKLFDDFYTINDLVEIEKIPDQYKLFAFLISFEFYIRALKDIRFNQNKNRDIYGDIDIKRNVNGTVKGALQLSANQFTEVLDYLLQEAKTIIQALIFHNYLYENKFTTCSVDAEIDWTFINQSSAHVHLIDLRKVLFETLEEWKYGYSNIKENDGNVISIEMLNKEDLLNYFVELERYENTRQINSRINNNKSFVENKLSVKLPPAEYINSIEYETYHECKGYFKTTHLNFAIKDISIISWIRAYAVIHMYNKDFLDKNTFPETSLPEEWLYTSTKEEWINKFVIHGINRKDAEVIFGHLTITKKSKDLFDNPFLAIDNKIITIPSIVSQTHIVSALISMSTNNNLNLDFKGYTFETHVINEFEKNNIDIVTVTRKYDNEEYQCDAAFVLGRDLFICECKNNVQPKSLSYRYRFYEERVQEDIAQLKRIGDFYKKNFQYVVEELSHKYKNSYSLDWKPRRVYYLLIYNSKIARRIKNSDVIVTDYSILSSFINKRYLTMFTDEATLLFKPPAKKGVLNGSLTTNKLLNFLETPWQIDYTKYFSEFSFQTIPLNNYKIERTKIYREIDHFYEIGNSNKFKELVLKQRKKSIKI